MNKKLIVELKKNITVESLYVGMPVVVISESSIGRLIDAAVVHPKKEKIDNVGKIFMMN